MANTVGQNFNSAGVSFFLSLIGGQRRLVVPHVDVPDIRWVDWKALHRQGYRGVVFDKDNTLTYPYKLEVYRPLGPSLKECMDTFDGKVALYSNSAGLYQFDPQGEEAETIEKALGVPVLRHHEKKPAGGSADLVAHFGCDAEQLIMVGDRYLTDIAFGAKNEMLTIRVAPLTSEGEPYSVWLARRLEDNMVWSFKKWGEEPPEQALLGDPPELHKFIKDPGMW